MKSNLHAALNLIVLGVLLLANNLIPEFRIWSTLLKWWPLALIALGVSLLARKH